MVTVNGEVVMRFRRAFIAAVTTGVLVLLNVPVATAADDLAPLNDILTPREFADAGNVSLLYADQGPIDVEYRCDSRESVGRGDSRVCSLRTRWISDYRDRRKNVIPWALHVHEYPSDDAAQTELLLPAERAFSHSSAPFPVMVDSETASSSGAIPTFAESSWANGIRVTTSQVSGQHRVTATCRTRARKPKQMRQARGCANRLVESQLERLNSPRDSRGAAVGDVYDTLVGPPTSEGAESEALRLKRTRSCRVIEMPGYPPATAPLEVRCELSNWEGRSVGEATWTGTTIHAASSDARARSLRDRWPPGIVGEASRSKDESDVVTSVVRSGTSVQVEVAQALGPVLVAVGCRGEDASVKVTRQCAREAMAAQVDFIEASPIVN